LVSCDIPNNNLTCGLTDVTPNNTLFVPCNGNCFHQEQDFTVSVSGNNPTPSQFQASAGGSVVTLQSGNYVVSETFPNVFSKAANKLSETLCKKNGFDSGGKIHVIPTCIEYSDGCGGIITGNEENRSCTIKNYLLNGSMR